MKQTLEQRSQKAIRTAVNKLVSNISIVALVIALLIIGMCYAGLTFSINVKIVATIAVSSIVLATSSLIIYELWVKSGIQNAKEQTEYITLLSTYETKAKGLNSEVMQEFIEAEKKRRFDVEEKKITTEIERLDKIQEHIKDSKSIIDKYRFKWNKLSTVKW